MSKCRYVLSEDCNNTDCLACVLNKIEGEINSPNRGTCDYFIVDRIEEIINKYKVKALEQESCEDAISREQAMAIIYKIKENYTRDRENHPINYGTLCDINLQLVNLPSVEPVRPNMAEYFDREK